jgi:hypothetical protein
MRWPCTAFLTYYPARFTIPKSGLPASQGKPRHEQAVFYQRYQEGYTVKKQRLFILFAIFILALGVRIYWLTQKDGFHLDESLSVSLAFCNIYMWGENYELNREYTGKEVKEISLCDNASLKNTAGDIIRLRRDTTDSTQTNLYYSFLRLALAGLKTGDIKTIVFRAGLLNILFFTVSFFFFYLLAKSLFPENTAVQFAALLCTFMSTAAISTTLFFRTYQLQGMTFIVFAFLFVKSAGWKKYIVYDNRLFINQKALLLMSAVMAFTLLSHYYAAIFIGIFGLYILRGNYRTKNYNEIIAYVSILVLGIIFVQRVYLGYFNGIGSDSYRAAEILVILFNGFSGNIKSSLLGIAHILNRFYFTWPVIAAGAAGALCLFFTKKKIVFEKNAAVVFAAAAAYLFIVLIIAPYKILRYVMPVLPFLVILPAAIINSIDNKKISLYAALLLSVCFSVYSFNGHNIENIFKNKPDSYVFAKEKEIPVVVKCTTVWKYNDLVPYFNDEQRYFFIDDLENISIPSIAMTGGGGGK